MFRLKNVVRSIGSAVQARWHSNSSDFKPLEGRRSGYSNDLIAPRELRKEDLSDPNIVKYFYRLDQLTPLFGNGIEKAFLKTVKFNNSGSGVLISNNGHVLFSAHCFYALCSRDSIFRTENGRVLGNEIDERQTGTLGDVESFSLEGAELVYIDNHSFDYWDPDLAVIRIPQLAGKGFISLSDEVHDLGHNLNGNYVLMIGKPQIMGNGLWVSVGRVLHFCRQSSYPNTGEQIVSDILRDSGNSGGPVVDRYGKLLAIHSAPFEGMKDKGVSIPVWRGSNANILAGLDQYFK